MTAPRFAQNQTLPDWYVTIIRRFYIVRNPRLNALLCAARRQGWTLQALANSVGVTRETIRYRAISGAQDEPWTGVVPPAPKRPPVPVKPPKPDKPRLSDEIIAELRTLHQTIRSVNGSTVADDPRRGVSVEFTARLARLIKEGYSAYYLAKVLGVTLQAVQFRLARHGLRTPPPSQAGMIYKGSPKWGVGASRVT